MNESYRLGKAKKRDTNVGQYIYAIFLSTLPFKNNQVTTGAATFMRYPSLSCMCLLVYLSEIRATRRCFVEGN